MLEHRRLIHVIWRWCVFFLSSTKATDMVKVYTHVQFKIISVIADVFKWFSTFCSAARKPYCSKTKMLSKHGLHGEEKEDMGVEIKRKEWERRDDDSFLTQKRWERRLRKEWENICCFLFDHCCFRTVEQDAAHFAKMETLEWKVTLDMCRPSEQMDRDGMWELRSTKKTLPHC